VVLLSYSYRFIANFMLLAAVYFGLSFLAKYEQRAILAILVLLYVLLRTVSVLRSFGFMHRIERLESELRRFMSAIGPADTQARRQLVADIAHARQHSEYKAYLDLMFLSLIALLCMVRIVTS
jgi:hypothetical protein